MIKKAKKGESSSRSSHHSDEGSHKRREDEGESHAQMVPYATPSRTREPESGLLLSPEELHKYISIRARGFAHTGIIDPVLLDNVGLDVEFDTVFNTIGWGGFWKVPEHDIKVLT